MSGSADVPDLPEPQRGASGAAPLEAGAERTDEFEVAGALLTDVGGAIGAAVL